MKHPSAGNNHTNQPKGGGKGRRKADGSIPIRNKGIKAAHDQERRERAYARGGTKPKEDSSGAK